MRAKTAQSLGCDLFLETPQNGGAFLPSKDSEGPNPRDSHRYLFNLQAEHWSDQALRNDLKLKIRRVHFASGGAVSAICLLQLEEPCLLQETSVLKALLCMRKKGRGP